MATDSGEIDGFVFSVGEFEGRRLIDVEFSERLSSARLAMIIDPFYSLWDDGSPTLQILDVSACARFDDDVHQFLKALIRRTIHQPGYVASAWLVGENVRIAHDVEWLLMDSVHVTNGIVRSRADAEAFLRRYLDDNR